MTTVTDMWAGYRLEVLIGMACMMYQISGKLNIIYECLFRMCGLYNYVDIPENKLKALQSHIWFATRFNSTREIYFGYIFGCINRHIFFGYLSPLHGHGPSSSNDVSSLYISSNAYNKYVNVDELSNIYALKEAEEEDISENSDDKPIIANEHKCTRITLCYREESCFMYNNITQHRDFIWHRSYVPNAIQGQVIEFVGCHLRKHASCVVLLHGPPGTGKTIVGLMLAAHYGEKTIYYPGADFTEPGISLDNTYDMMQVSETSPFIIQIDEVDTLLHRVHHGTVPTNPKHPVFMRNKTTWNTMLDNIANGMYPYLVLVLTSNRSFRELNETYDVSYLRPGRVNGVFEFKDPVV